MHIVFKVTKKAAELCDLMRVQLLNEISSILIYCFYQTILCRWSLSTPTDTISKMEVGASMGYRKRPVKMG